MKPNEAQVPRAEKRDGQSDKMNRILRPKLAKLCRMRCGNHNLPDNLDGRAMLTALLCFGLSDDSAIEDAPWCASQLSDLKRQARRLRWRDVGKLIALTYAEREACKLWHLDPCDVSPEEVKRRQADKRKTQDSARKKRKRELERSDREHLRSANKRGDAVVTMLELNDRAFPRKPGANPPRFHGEWTPVSTLVELAAKSKAFRRPDGLPLRDLKSAIHRTIKRLAGFGIVETRLEQGSRGNIMLVRKTAVSGKADGFCHRGSVASALPAKAQKTRAFECKIVPSAGKADTVPTSPTSQPERKAA